MQLFSSPQQAQAARISSEPTENEMVCPGLIERITLETVIKAIAIQSFFEIFSENNASAMIDVATISKLPSSAALSADARCSPSINKIGAAMSKRIMPSTNGISCFVRRDWCSVLRNRTR